MGMLSAGLEPATAALLAPRSNQLSYESAYSFGYKYYFLLDYDRPK